MLHIAGHGLEDNPYSTDGREKGPWNGAERMKIAAIDNPAHLIERDDNENCLYQRQVANEHFVDAKEAARIDLGREMAGPNLVK